MELTDEEIIAVRKAQVGRYGGCDVTKPYSDSIAFARALLSHIAKREQAPAGGDGVKAVPAHTGGPGRIYVTCYQCDQCQHIGINDEHPTEAACNRGACGWHGPSPTEDRCPGCGKVGTMSTACPECGGHYVLLADADLARAAAPLAGEGDGVARQRYFDALCWALGAGGEFPTRAEGQGAYWWRKELMERAGLDWNGEQFVDAATPSTPPTAPDGEARDAARLDWLDARNKALNAHYGTKYGWKVVLSPNVTRVMTERTPADGGYVADVDVHDAQARGHDSIRAAIDAAMAGGSK